MNTFVIGHESLFWSGLVIKAMDLKLDFSILILNLLECHFAIFSSYWYDPSTTFLGATTTRATITAAEVLELWKLLVLDVKILFNCLLSH